MFKEQRLEGLLSRNDEWLQAKILTKAKSFKDIHSVLIDAPSWHNTLSKFTELIVILLKEASRNKPFETQRQKELLDYLTLEVKKCIKQNISADTFLAFLKDIRSTYTELIGMSKLFPKEKRHYICYLQESFDKMEINTLKQWSTILKNNKIRRPNNHQFDFNRAMLNAFPFPVIIVNRLHEIIWYNKETQKQFNFINFQQLKISDLVKDLNSKIELSKRINKFSISMQQKASFKTELITTRYKIYAEFILKKLPPSNNIMISLVDISKWQKETDILKIEKNKAIESNHLKTLFLANISHEIRTPMNAIVGFSELLSIRNASPQDKKKYLEIIKKSSNDLLNIIEDVIDIAKIESHRLKLHLQATKPSIIIQDLALYYRDFLKRQGKQDVNIIINIPEAENDLSFHTDPKRLKQVFTNLIGNACKFTHVGQIEIGYKIARNNLIYFYVKDTGVGIPYDLQPKIFNQFVQDDNLHNINKIGSGLGLTICRNIIKLLGGKIWVSSIPGNGANFYFFLPFTKTKQKLDAASINNQDLDINMADLSAIKMLVVEDDKTSFTILNELLRPSRINITYANSGASAIQTLKHNKTFDLVLMDIRMPGINGIETTKLIRTFLPNLPIIALTALAMESDREECLNAGCNDFIKKPFSTSHLINIILKYTSKRKLHIIKN